MNFFINKLAIIIMLTATATSANCASYWTYMYQDSTYQYIYLIGNPNYTGSLPWWNCPEGLMPQGFPTTAAPFTIVTDTSTGKATSGLSTISFITNLNTNGSIIPGGSAASGTCRLALAVLGDGKTVGFKDISATGSAATTPGCLWKIINDGPDANGIEHSRLIAAASLGGNQLFLTFQDGLCVLPIDQNNPNSMQFSMLPSDTTGEIIYSGNFGPSPLTAIDGFDGLPTS